jgi:ribosome-binding ATPase YchF (GTP1/OBG family)
VLEAGIVGLPAAGKTTLFNVLTRAGVGPDFGKEHVGMAPIADERLGQLAEVVAAAKVTPAAARVTDVPGTGPQLLGNLRRVDALLEVADGFSAGADPEGDFERLELELLVADRDHVERRLERVGKQAKSGDAKLRQEAAELERVLEWLDAGRSLRDWQGELPPELEPLTTKPVVPVVNGPAGIDLKLEAELAELPEEEAAAFRDGGSSAVGEVARRLFEVLDLVTFFTAGEKETRAWTLRRGGSALDAAGTIHSDIARGFIRCEVIRWDDLVAAGSHTDAARDGKQRLEGKTYVVQDGDVLNIRFNV